MEWNFKRFWHSSSKRRAKRWNWRDGFTFTERSNGYSCTFGGLDEGDNTVIIMIVYFINFKGERTLEIIWHVPPILLLISKVPNSCVEIHMLVNSRAEIYWYFFPVYHISLPCDYLLFWSFYIVHVICQDFLVFGKI